MRKIVLLFLAAMFMTVPAMAVSNVTITCVDDDVNMVTVSYTSNLNRIRAFGLDITVTGANITGVVPVDVNYRIFPGQIVIADGNVTAYGTCYDPCDLGDGSVTVEMGSLYTEDPCYAGDPNMGYGMKPGLGPSPLLKFYVSGDCNYSVDVNATRGGIVMEDPCEIPTDNLPCAGSIIIISGCTVPDVVGMTEVVADACITAAGLTPGTSTQECNSTVADGLVLRTDPVGGSLVTCGSDVNKVISLNPPLPGAASNPTPTDGATCVAIDANLSWTAGANTATQDIYFGTTNPPPPVASGVPVGTTTYDTGTMAIYTCYFWRIDELNACGGKTTGTVWHFKTGPTNSLWPCCATCLGDVTNDGWAKIDDVSALDLLLRTAPGNRYQYTSPNYKACGDYNQDGWNKIDDVSAIDLMLRPLAGNRKKCPTCP